MGHRSELWCHGSMDSRAPRRLSEYGSPKSSPPIPGT